MCPRVPLRSAPVDGLNDGLEMQRKVPERTLQRLTGLSVERAKRPGYIHDGGGLYLRISPAGRKGWIFRYMLAGKRRDMGLGPYPAVSLATARKSAAEARGTVGAGIDPIAVRDAQRARQRLEEVRRLTFDEAAAQYIDEHGGMWRSAKHRMQWRSSLDSYASPAIGSMSVADVGTVDVKRVLAPIWNRKFETASRLRGRIERILDWAKANGHRTGENPARLKNLALPARSQDNPVNRHVAVPIDDLPGVYLRLCEIQDVAALALRFVILTAARAGEAVGARWSEIDLEKRIWTIPGDRMKAGEAHSVPLSDGAMAVLKASENAKVGDLVFPGWRNGRPVSLTPLSKVMKAAADAEATVHGLRSTFRDWVAERTNYPREVAEMALAHSVGSKVEAAYQRSKLIERRRPMMQAWSDFAVASPGPAVVVPFRSAA
jgi:integrase